MKKLLLLLTLLFTFATQAKVTGLVIVKADWCGYCKKYKPIAEKVAKEKGLSVEYLDLDKDKSPIFQYVRGVPATFFIIDGKSLVGAIPGYVDEKKLKCFLESINKDPKAEPIHCYK